jgi:hypothetical protein
MRASRKSGRTQSQSVGGTALQTVFRRKGHHDDGLFVVRKLCASGFSEDVDRFAYLDGGASEMPKFAVGDHVERVGVLVPEYMRYGLVTRVKAIDVGQDVFYEYEVDFGNQMVGTFYEPQLHLIKHSS